MRKGFMDFVATRLIPESPGGTAEWYAKEYVELFGKDASDAKKPVQSLASTLAKQVREGREKRVRRERIGGEYRFFPVNSTSPGEGEALESIAVQILLYAQELQILDDFVAVGSFRNRGDALVWLAREGIKARRDDIEKVAQVRKQIEELKKSIPTV